MPGALVGARQRVARRSAPPASGVALPHARHLDVVLAIVHRDVQHRGRVHDRRQDLQRAEVVDVGGTAAPARVTARTMSTMRARKPLS